MNEAFAKSGNQAAADNPEPGDPDDTFIDLYVAPVSVPTIGRSLLGDAGYEQLKARLKPGQQAIVVAGDGAYSFKGSGYVRGGIFDRIELLQEGQSTRFRDRNHTRLGDLAAEGAPDLREIALFVVPEEFSLDLTEPWQLQLLVQRSVGARDKAFLTFDLDYTPARPVPPIEQPPPSPAPLSPAAASASRASLPAPAAPSLERRRRARAGAIEEPLWLKIWKTNTVSIGITVVALLVLTGDLLLPGRAGAAATRLRLGAARLPRLHAGLARLVRQRPALGRQRPHLHQLARHRLQLGVLPRRAADLHPVGGGRGGRCCSGAAGPSAAGSARSARCRN